MQKIKTELQEFDEIIKSFKEPYVLNKYSKKNLLILSKFIDKLKNNKNILSKILEDENTYWDNEYTIEVFYKNLKKYSDFKEEKNQKFGIGNIIAIPTGNPYLHLELIINAIIANCKIMIIANPNMFQFNLFVTQVIRSILEEENLDKNLISYVNILDYKTKILENQNVIDCIILNQDYDEYNYFVKNIVSKVIYLDYGNINIYSDSNDFKEKIDDIVNKTYKIDMQVYDYNIDNLDIFIEKNNNNFIFNTAIIFSKDIKKCMRLYEILKARNIFINTFDINKIDIGLDINDLLFDKKIIIEDGN